MTESAELDPRQTGVGMYCAPGPAEGQQPRWLLYFDDADRTSAVYDDEKAARRAFAAAEARGWNCYLFEPARRAPAEAGAPDGWKLVPEILTTEMHSAAVDKDNEALDDSGKPASIEGLWLAMLAAAPAAPKEKPARVIGAPGRPVLLGCGCHTCRPLTMQDSRMILCPTCGNKRCPKANDHRNACSGSNVPGQPGSAYPKQERP